MRARRIIEGAAFGPDVLHVVRQAFDEAWRSVAEKIPLAEHENVREELAKAMMSATRDDSADVKLLCDAGIRALQVAYPKHFNLHGTPTEQGNKIG